jgi:hypothetical protein
MVVLPTPQKRLTLLVFWRTRADAALVVSVSAQERPEIRVGDPRQAVESVRNEKLLFDPAPNRARRHFNELRNLRDRVEFGWRSLDVTPLGMCSHLTSPSADTHVERNPVGCESKARCLAALISASSVSVVLLSRCAKTHRSSPISNQRGQCRPTRVSPVCSLVRAMSSSKNEKARGDGAGKHNTPRLLFPKYSATANKLLKN